MAGRRGVSQEELREYLGKHGFPAGATIPAGAGFYVIECDYGNATKCYVRGRGSVYGHQKGEALVRWAPLTLGNPATDCPPGPTPFRERMRKEAAEMAERAAAGYIMPGDI